MKIFFISSFIIFQQQVNNEPTKIKCDSHTFFSKNTLIHTRVSSSQFTNLIFFLFQSFFYFHYFQNNKTIQNTHNAYDYRYDCVCKHIKTKFFFYYIFVVIVWIYAILPSFNKHIFWHLWGVKYWNTMFVKWKRWKHWEKLKCI